MRFSVIRNGREIAACTSREAAEAAVRLQGGGCDIVPERPAKEAQEPNQDVTPYAHYWLEGSKVALTG